MLKLKSGCEEEKALGPRALKLNNPREREESELIHVPLKFKKSTRD